MKRWIWIVLGIPAVIILMVTAMFAFKLCPPKGPWPMPPWCSYLDVKPYEYHEVSYLPEAYPHTEQKLDLGIGTWDIWGNPHLWIDLGDITTKNSDTTLERMHAIGSKIWMLTDFALFHNDGTVTIPTPKDSPGTYNIYQSEMNSLVKKAKSEGQQKIILMLNLVEMKGDIEGAREAFEKNKDIGSQIVLDLAEKQLSDSGDLSSSAVIKEYDKEQRAEFLSNWKEFVLYEARKAEKAGITHIVINPRHANIDWLIPIDELNPFYKDLFESVKKEFSGKVGFWDPIHIITTIDTSYFDFILVDQDGNWYRDEPVVPKDLEAMKQKWQGYFSRSEWSHLENKEVYLLVTISSIEHGFSRGWIPPAEQTNDAVVDQEEQAIAYEALFETLYDNNPGIDGVISYGYFWSDKLYPETKVLRSDLMHTIRSKDAEHVFKKWSTVFS